MSAQELLNNLRQLVESYDWSKEVRLNWLREFARTLVFFKSPEYALEFDKLSKDEFLMPKGIIAITRLLNGRYETEAKIAGIKKILKERGYEGEIEGGSCIRTHNTHIVYGLMAKMIAGYERGEECYAPVLF